MNSSFTKVCKEIVKLAGIEDKVYVNFSNEADSVSLKIQDINLEPIQKTSQKEKTQKINSRNE
jgi:predicted nucleic acid-binding OB-fold protein